MLCPVGKDRWISSFCWGRFLRIEDKWELSAFLRALGCHHLHIFQRQRTLGEERSAAQFEKSTYDFPTILLGNRKGFLKNDSLLSAQRSLLHLAAGDAKSLVETSGLPTSAWRRLWHRQISSLQESSGSDLRFFFVSVCRPTRWSGRGHGLGSTVPKFTGILSSYTLQQIRSFSHSLFRYVRAVCPFPPSPTNSSALLPYLASSFCLMRLY